MLRGNNSVVNWEYSNLITKSLVTNLKGILLK